VVKVTLYVTCAKPKQETWGYSVVVEPHDPQEAFKAALGVVLTMASGHGDILGASFRLKSVEPYRERVFWSFKKGEAKFHVTT
jgi:hypothetical protein